MVLAGIEINSRCSSDQLEIKTRPACQGGVDALLTPSGPLVLQTQLERAPPAGVSPCRFSYLLHRIGWWPASEWWQGGRGFPRNGAMGVHRAGSIRGEARPSCCSLDAVCIGCGVPHPSMSRSAIGFAHCGRLSLVVCCRSEVLVLNSRRAFGCLPNFWLLVVVAHLAAGAKPSMLCGREKHRTHKRNTTPRSTITHVTLAGWRLLPARDTLGKNRILSDHRLEAHWKPIGSPLEPPTVSTRPKEWPVINRNARATPPAAEASAGRSATGATTPERISARLCPGLGALGTRQPGGVRV